MSQRYKSAESWIQQRCAEIQQIATFIWQFKFLARKAILANVCGGTASALQLIIASTTIPIINKVVIARNLHLLVYIAGVIALLTVGSLLLGYIEFQLNSEFRERATIALETKLFDTLQTQTYSFFKKHESGYLLSRLFNDSSTAIDLLTIVTTVGRISCLLIGALVLLPMLDRSLGMLIASLLPLYFLLLVRFQSRTKKVFELASERTALASREMAESLSGIYEIKAFGAEKHRLRRYLSVAVARARALLHARLLMSAGEQTTHVVTLLISFVVITYGASEVVAGKLSLGRLVGINAIASYLLFPVTSVVQQILKAQRAMAAIERIEEWLNLPREQAERAPICLSRMRGHVRYQNIAFSYKDRPVLLRDITLEVRSGEVILLTGPSGAGKTTLVNLLARFFEPTGGTIFIDGVPVNCLPLSFLRKQIAFVSQDIFLFSDSVRNNIRMGDRLLTHEQISDAAYLANALDFIRSLPEGFDTQVGERGARLSGGQRQRIAIARALVRNAPILVLDEATSAVDPETETAVHEALCTLMENRTTIIIAHHPAAFLGYIDRSYVLEDGYLKGVPTSLFGIPESDSLHV